MEIILIPSLFALISLLVPKGITRVFGLGAAVTSLIIALVHVFGFSDTSAYVSIFDPHITTSFGLTYKMGYDGVSLFMVLLTNAIVFLILLSNHDGKLAENRLFLSMVFFMQAGLLGVFTAMDGLMFYIFWEITLIPIFLIALWWGEPNRKTALIKFFLYTFIGSLAMLLSLIALKMNAASFSHEDLMAVSLSSKAAFWIMGGFFLAFAIKSPLFPFHTWQPDTYTLSPMAGTMLLSALMLKMALYGMVRWMIPMAPEALADWKEPIVILGVIGIVYAGIIAIKQNDLKRLYAFSSISHVGLIVAAIALFTTNALSAVFVQIANHSLVAVGIFLVVEIIERRWHTRNLSEMGGIAKLAPKFGFWFAAVTFASMSVPFTSGFIGEFLMIKDLYLYQWLIGILAGSALVFGAAYNLRAYQRSMFSHPTRESFTDLTWSELSVMALVVLMIVFLGVYPQALIDFVKPAIEHIVDATQASTTLIY